MFVHSLGHRRSTPQLNLLAPLADTPIQAEYHDRLTLDELCSDMCHQGRGQNESDRDLIKNYPAISLIFTSCRFPIWIGTTFWNCASLCFWPRQIRWLIVALHRSTSDLLKVFSAWREHRVQQMPGLRGWRRDLTYPAGPRR
jgi:hypothetical protein